MFILFDKTTMFCLDHRCVVFWFLTFCNLTFQVYYQHLGHLLLLFQAYYQGAGLEVEK